MVADCCSGGDDQCRSDLHDRLQQLIIDRAKVPVPVDADVGTSSDAAIAKELGAEAGREAWLAGRMAKNPCQARPSSPTEGLIRKTGS